MNNRNEPLTFTVPLSWEAHTLAQEYLSGLRSPQKAKQVYLNTLAVYAVDHYLRCLGFKPDFVGSDSRNHIVVNFLNVADLSISKLGKLECCPVLPDAQFLEIPAEAWPNRMGYLAIRMEESLKQAEILGFTLKPVAQMPLATLKSMSEFPGYLKELQRKYIAEQLTPFYSSAIVHLSKWFEGVSSSGWKAIDAVCESSPYPLSEVRGLPENRPIGKLDIQQAKLIDVGMQLGDQTVVLSLTLSPGNDQKMSALVQVQPLYGDIYLPPNLKLKMLSESGEALQEVKSRSQDNYIKLKRFSGKVGDRFQLQMSLNTVSTTEFFVF